MKKLNHALTSRRQFITRIAPACAMTCVGGKGLLGMMHLSAQQEGKHKFDQPIDFPITYRQFQRNSNRGKIQLIKTLIKELGEERAIEIIKTDTRESAFAMGQSQAKAAEKNDFDTYVNMFRDPKRYTNTLTKEIIEVTTASEALKYARERRG